MWLRTSCDLSFNVEIPTPFILMLRPRSGAQQWVARELYTLQPSGTAIEFTDTYGNLCQRLIAEPGAFSIHTSADVLTADNLDIAWGAPLTEVQNLPDGVLAYLLPSRYCESDRLGDLASEITCNTLPGYDQVACIVDWVSRSVRNTAASSNLRISALETLARGEGVCRDLAHLAIALCRSLSIPSRMVVGYLYGLEPMDLHAWFEAYLDGRWYTFDPTQDDIIGGRVAIAYGRDATDVAVYNQFGPALFPSTMQVSVDLLNDPPT